MRGFPGFLVTDAEVEAGARPGESWEEARARIDRAVLAEPEADYRPLDDDGEWEVWEFLNIAEHKALIMAGLWEQRCAEMKAEAEAHPIPFEPSARPEACDQAAAHWSDDQGEGQAPPA